MQRVNERALAWESGALTTASHSAFTCPDVRMLRCQLNDGVVTRQVPHDNNIPTCSNVRMLVE